MTSPAPDLGPVPEDNQPGHHPPVEQDRPDLDALADRLGTAGRADDGEEGRPPADRLVTATAGLAAVPVGLVRAGLWSAGYVAGLAPRAVGRRLGIST